MYKIRFSNLSQIKEEPKVIFDLWCFLYDAFKKEIWNIRYEEVIEWKREQGITTQEKRSKKVEGGDIIEKSQKLIKT